MAIVASVFGVLYFMIGMGVAIEMSAVNVPTHAAIACGAVWPIVVGGIIGNQFVPLEQAHYRRAGKPFDVIP